MISLESNISDTNGIHYIDMSQKIAYFMTVWRQLNLLMSEYIIRVIHNLILFKYHLFFLEQYVFFVVIKYIIKKRHQEEKKKEKKI